MSEFSLSPSTPTSPTKKRPQFSTLLLYDFMLFCSFILSHPLYFSCIVFFSPYLFKILSFLSPLFVTTSLLLLALFTLTPGIFNEGSCLEFSESKVGFLLTTYQTLVESFRPRVDDGTHHDFGCFEELEAFKIVFDTSTIEIRESSVEILEPFAKETPPAKCSTNSVSENLVEIKNQEAVQVVVDVKSLEGFLQEKEKSEDLSCEMGEKEVKAQSVVFDKREEEKQEESIIKGSKAMGNSKVGEAKVYIDNAGDYASKVMVNFENPKVAENYNQTLGSNLRSYGSMRKEKEWKKTLACKLFEERHNVDGGEGMDLLWETYETDSNKMQLKSSSSKKGKKGSSNQYRYGDDEDDDDYEEESDGQLCCLQALKFSAGKMNLGMGRPNLMKISKALKGIGWLHHVSSRKGKKVHR